MSQSASYKMSISQVYCCTHLSRQKTVRLRSNHSCHGLLVTDEYLLNLFLIVVATATRWLFKLSADLYGGIYSITMEVQTGFSSYTWNTWHHMLKHQQWQFSHK